jgi:hypothetical protein
MAAITFACAAYAFAICRSAVRSIYLMRTPARLFGDMRLSKMQVLIQSFSESGQGGLHKPASAHVGL